MQVAQRFDCLSVTLEMPFKDCANNPDPAQVGVDLCVHGGVIHRAALLQLGSTVDMHIGTAVVPRACIHTCLQFYWRPNMSTCTGCHAVFPPVQGSVFLEIEHQSA